MTVSLMAPETHDLSRNGLIPMAKFDSVQDYLNALPEPQQQITDELLPIIEAALPGTGALYQGHPVWSAGERPGKSPVCYVKAYSSYVTFGLWKGQMLTDPSGRLDAGARGMAGIKLRLPRRHRRRPVHRLAAPGTSHGSDHQKLTQDANAPGML